VLPLVVVADTNLLQPHQEVHAPGVTTLLITHSGRDFQSAVYGAPVKLCCNSLAEPSHKQSLELACAYTIIELHLISSEAPIISLLLCAHKA
jgi:hypothetical protein